MRIIDKYELFMSFIFRQEEQGNWGRKGHREGDAGEEKSSDEAESANEVVKTDRVL